MNVRMYMCTNVRMDVCTNVCIHESLKSKIHRFIHSSALKQTNNYEFFHPLL